MGLGWHREGVRGKQAGCSARGKGAPEMTELVPSSCPGDRAVKIQREAATHGSQGLLRRPAAWFSFPRFIFF